MVDLFSAQESESDLYQVVTVLFPFDLAGLKGNLCGCPAHVQEAIGRPIIYRVCRLSKPVHEVVDGNPAKKTLFLTADDADARATRPLGGWAVYFKVRVEAKEGTDSIE